MKTDLSKVLSVSGQHGLFNYVAQARGGVIAEAMSTGKRISLDVRNKITSLADVSIFTTEGELKLSEVFLAIRKALAGAEAPGAKAPESEIKALFAKAVPDYDADRFYLSHMRKILDWYSDLAKYASFDFESEEDKD